MHYQVEIIVRQRHIIIIEADSEDEAKDKVIGDMDWSRFPEDEDQEVSAYEKPTASDYIIQERREGP